MPGTSRVTKVMVVRLPVGLAARIEANARKRNITVSEYLRWMISHHLARRR